MIDEIFTKEGEESSEKLFYLLKTFPDAAFKYLDISERRNNVVATVLGTVIR